MHATNDPAVPFVDPAEVAPSKGSDDSVSPRKQAANRANAAHSTGPRTPEGKARSSQNAVRHGLTAHAVVMLGEDPEEFEELCREVEADLCPRGAMERDLVGRIAGLTWRLRRAARLEGALWEHDDLDRLRSFTAARQVRQQFGYPLMPGQSDEPPEEIDGDEFFARQFRQKGNSALERLGIYEQRIDRSRQAALRQLMQLQKQRAERPEVERTESPAPAADNRANEQNEATADPAPASPPAVSQNEPTEPPPHDPPAPAPTAPDPPRDVI